MKTKKVALLGVLGALALVLGFLEHLVIPDIPFLPVGAKPGLSNVVTMFTLMNFGFPAAIYITLIKALFALITRGVTASVMSLCAGIFSVTVMCVMLKFKDKVFSLVGISILSAVAHNMAQLAVACVISGTVSLVNYSKYLLIFSLVTGFVTGSMLTVLVPRVGKIKSIYIKDVEPALFHVMVTMISGIVHFGSLSHTCGSTPNHPKIMFSTPVGPGRKK